MTDVLRKKPLSAQWLETNHDNLDNYTNEWIAIGPTGVLAHDALLDDVLQKTPTREGSDVLYMFVHPPAPTIIRQ
jgi:hypothetical protein